MLNSISASVEACFPPIHYLIISVQRRKMVLNLFEGTVLSRPLPHSASGDLGLKVGHYGNQSSRFLEYALHKQP